MAGDKPSAGAQPQRLVKKVAEEIVKEAKNSQSRGRRWQRPRNQKQKPQAQAQAQRQVVTKQITRKLKKEGLEGPRSRFSVRVSATIGKIGPNKNQGPELQISTFLHPSLMKEPNDGTNFGPLQAAAAQWGLWRLTNLKIKCTPLVGPSAVTGSVYRVSLNLTQSPGSTSWGGLGARKHIDVPVGKQSTWALHRGDLAGPRQTWWMTDTNEEGGQSCGPMIEIHGLGKTSSTYKDEPWVGDLFIVEVTGHWEFTNYNLKPALGTLNRVTEDVQAKIEVPEDGVMTMTIPASSLLARHMSTDYEKSTNATSVGETIWQIVDEGANLVANVSPPPFQWLIKGGWWFVKKALGRSMNSDEVYYVYASLADAQNNKPVEAPRFQSQAYQTTLSSTQINAPNTGPSQQVTLVKGVEFPITPEPFPSEQVSFFLSGMVTPMFSIAVNLENSAMLHSVFPVHGSGDPTDFAFSLIRPRQTQTAGKAMGAVILQSDPVITTLNLDIAGSEITAVYDAEDLPPLGWQVNFNAATAAITDCADVLAYRHETLATGHTMSCWLVRLKKSIPRADYNTYVIFPSAHYGQATSLAPTTINADKIAIPKMATHDQVYGQQLVKVSGAPQGTFLILYSIGNYTFDAATGFATPPTIQGAVNDFTVDKGHRSLLPTFLMSPLMPPSFFVSLGLTKPRQTSDHVDAVIQEIQRRFRLTPIDEEEDYDVVDPPPRASRGPTPCSKLAKQRMYEALRDSDWDHVDADAFINVISKASNRSRGHAE
nr:capsid protein [Porcine astrovirus 3]